MRFMLELEALVMLEEAVCLTRFTLTTVWSRATYSDRRKTFQEVVRLLL